MELGTTCVEPGTPRMEPGTAWSDGRNASSKPERLGTILDNQHPYEIECLRKRWKSHRLKLKSLDYTGIPC